ncbi:hypothetical protein MSG28_013547 [Choristoneura fumiferana]|uniref:Uncharacterized protein n=1 Tax=Choristoneura fumiferana TaxID=7141 RepID=A0ACC0K7Y9_CHOFU|nr:hypothetical protein MSG28_013547 [Choristoneura fumiferana]
MADPCPPRIPCPPMPPSPCPQICPPPPPAPPCRVKPVMRGLHWAQTERHIFKAFALAALGGIAFTYLLVMPRRATYREFYATLKSCKTGRALVWDATYTDTLAASYLPATTKCAGAAADARERLKVTKYSCLGAQYHFLAFGVETLGPWSKDALELHRELSNRLREATGNPRAGSFLAQRISIAAQFNAGMLPA